MCGAGGSIGSELCRQLNEQGHHVSAIDNLSRGNVIPEGYFIEGDITDNSENNKNGKDS